MSSNLRSPSQIFLVLALLAQILLVLYLGWDDVVSNLRLREEANAEEEVIFTMPVYKEIEALGVSTLQRFLDRKYEGSMQQEGSYLLIEAPPRKAIFGTTSLDILHASSHHSYDALTLQVPPSAVLLIGSDAGETGHDATFIATVSPYSTTQPVTYIWEADGFPLLIQSGGLTETATFSWNVTGEISLTVTAENTAGSVVATQEFTSYVAEGRYQEDSPTLKLAGDWVRQVNSNADSGGYLISNTFGDNITLTFGGDSIVLLHKKEPEGGFVSIAIDNGYYDRMLPFHAPEDRWQVPAIIEGLGNGIHTMTMVIGQDMPGGWPYTNVNIDAFVLPSFYSPTKVQEKALERVNYYRAIANLPLAQGRQPIHMGAQAHAEFITNNRTDPRMAGLGVHREYEDLPGFTGTFPGDRAAYFGYSHFLGEDVHFVGDPVHSVDDWLDSVYHRIPIMCYSCVDLGYGMVGDQRGRVDVLNTGSRTSPALSQRVIFTYPADGQKDVPILWRGGEFPDPLPNVSKPVGYPISLHIQQPPSSPWDMWQLTKAELRTQSGQLVPTYVLEQSNDPNSLIAPDEVFIIPHKPLLHTTNYEARVIGIDGAGVPFDYIWSFTTRKPSPDLTVAAPWLYINTSAPNTIPQITVSVQNLGEVSAENVQVAFYVGDPQQGGQQIGETQVITQIDGGGSSAASIYWQPHQAGKQTITAHVDVDNMITESSEDNNLSATELEFPASSNSVRVFLPAAMAND